MADDKLDEVLSKLQADALVYQSCEKEWVSGPRSDEVVQKGTALFREASVDMPEGFIHWCCRVQKVPHQIML